MREDPVLIHMQSRSGSSMVAGIFKEHGLWTGAPLIQSVAGKYITHENRQIKYALQGRYGSKKHELVPDPVGVKEVFAHYVPPNTPWMFKGGFIWYHMFRDVFEAPRFVFVVRRPESIAASWTTRKKHGNYDVWLKTAIGFQQEIRETAARDDVPLVDADEVVAGEYRTLEAAFDRCGMDFDPEIARLNVDPQQWHHR